MANGDNVRRQTAYKVRISDLVNGSYVKEEGWTPNYIVTANGLQISRANIIGVLIEKDINQEGYSSLVIDDGSATIAVRSFERHPILEELETGDIILIIGKPREYGNEKYIVPEIIKKVENKKWLEVRKAELELQELSSKLLSREKEPKISIEESKKKGNIEAKGSAREEYSDKELLEEAREAEIIYNLVKDLDKGGGAPIEEIIKKSNLKNAEHILNKFIKEGEVFQIRPGRVKVLE